MLLMEYDQSVDSVHIQLVVHVFVRTRTLFLHLIRSFILSTTPKAIVVFRAQILQNAIEAFRGLVKSSVGCQKKIFEERGKGEGGLRNVPRNSHLNARIAQLLRSSPAVEITKAAH